MVAADTGLRETHLTGARLVARGKVRDIYAVDATPGGDPVGDTHLLLVATDRISAFDAVLPTPIPDRGKILTQLSTFWFRKTAHIVPNHLLTDDPAGFPAALQPDAALLRGRSMLVRRAARIDVECVARGYITGSAWSEYRQQGTVGGERLPGGLVEHQPLDEPLFTPAIKAAEGHDENISFAQLVSLVGAPLAGQLRRTTLAIYAFAAGYASERGLIIADTKLEFGLLPAQPAQNGGAGDRLRNEADGTSGTLLLIDELLTPDSSRFWDAATYRPGTSPASFDKQYLRDFLLASGWNKEPPAPALPDAVVAQTRERYIDAFRRLSGAEPRWLGAR